MSAVGVASIRLFNTAKTLTQRLSVGHDESTDELVIDVARGLGEDTKITHANNVEEASGLLQQPGVYFDYLEFNLDVMAPREAYYLEILARTRNDLRDLKADENVEDAELQRLKKLIETPEGEQAALELLVKQKMMSAPT